jgi:hypothetical protein
MHATNTFPVDRHPQYRQYPTTIRSIASGIIIEVKEKPHHAVRELSEFGPSFMPDVPDWTDSAPSPFGGDENPGGNQ